MKTEEILQKFADLVEQMKESMKPDPHVSAYKAGKRFNDEWDYAGRLEIPDPESDIWVAISHGDCACHGSANENINGGLREILVPRQPEFWVGQVVVGKH